MTAMGATTMNEKDAAERHPARPARRSTPSRARSAAGPGYDDARRWSSTRRSEPAAQADRRNVRGKLAAGWRGLKSAVRGDSSFFAHWLSRDADRHHGRAAGHRSTGLVPAGARPPAWS